jgi:hypothetical protein
MRGAGDDLIGPPSIFPECLEPIWSKLRVLDRVRDVAVPEVVLNRPRVMPVVGQLEPRRVAEHVRVDWEAELGDPAGSAHQFSDR